MVNSMPEDNASPSDGSKAVASTRRRKEERRCDFCSQVFFKAEHLARHVRIHTREKPFRCEVCKKSFTRHDTLLRHARSHADAGDSQRSSSLAITPLGDTGAGLGPPIHFESISQPASGTTEHFQSSTSQQMIHLDPTGFLSHNIPATSPIGVDQSASSEMASYQMTGSTIDSDVMNTLNDTGMWNMDYDMTNWPSWSVGSDFDLQAMNASIAATIMDPGVTLQPMYEQYAHLEDLPNTPNVQSGSRERTLDAVSQSWISQKTHMIHGTVTPMNEGDNERADVDESYRSSLTRRLQSRPYDNSLPSTDFLNLCVQLYFARFHPIFPIVHAPSFRPSISNSLLLISVCSIGSLFIGSPSATSQGIKIFETLHKCILNSWEKYLSRSGKESLSMIQAAIIGQTFGFLSGIPNHPHLVDAFCGTIISWARRGKMFKAHHAKQLDEKFHRNRDILNEAWKSWIQSEQMIRVVLALNVHDAELAVMFHHEPLLRHELERTPIAASERLFSASNSSQWAALSLQEAQRHPQNTASNVSGLDLPESNPRAGPAPGMTEYALLEGIGAAICEKRQQGQLDAASQAAFTNDLIAWSTGVPALSRDHSADPFCLMILWHSTFISLFADFEMLERAIGKDGSIPALELQGEVIEWASSTSAKRCVIHASLLSNQLDSMHVGSEPAIHVPHCLFRAAIAWYLYAHFARCNDSRDLIDSPEIQNLGITPSPHLFKTSDHQFGKPTVAESRKLYALRDLLQRVGHWGISRKFANILGILLEDDAMNNPGLGQ